MVEVSRKVLREGSRVPGWKRCWVYLRKGGAWLGCPSRGPSQVFGFCTGVFSGTAGAGRGCGGLWVEVGRRSGYKVWRSMCAQMCLTLCNPMDCSLPSSSLYGILQAALQPSGSLGGAPRNHGGVYGEGSSHATLRLGLLPSPRATRDAWFPGSSTEVLCPGKRGLGGG